MLSLNSKLQILNSDVANVCSSQVPGEPPLPGDFDPAIYLAFNKDVADAGVDATEHYLQYGMRERRPYK